MAEPWLSAEEIAAHLGITKDTVYDWISEKKMPAHRVGRLWKFQVSEIDEWVRSGGAAPSHGTTRATRDGCSAMSEGRRMLINLPFSRGGVL
ncbi:helix-turn-helix domain-containing protein [Microbacterium gubbeenense]|uniref:helix-turn-helix domain-containing protein n=1 Tax=Microbacterium TaxID=33882 RepID=UPI000409C72E